MSSTSFWLSSEISVDLASEHFSRIKLVKMDLVDRQESREAFERAGWNAQ
jgi:hypothetical protein